MEAARGAKVLLSLLISSALRRGRKRLMSMVAMAANDYGGDGSGARK